MAFAERPLLPQSQDDNVDLDLRVQGRLLALLGSHAMSALASLLGESGHAIL